MSAQGVLVFDEPGDMGVVELEEDGGISFILLDARPEETRVVLPGAPTTDLLVLTPGGPRGPQGPPGVAVIDSDQQFPPEGTPLGTVVYQRI